MRDPTSPGSKLDPRSPTRRTTDELAALQMAELGARQAAFEARLHVAINRISSTLSDVGDVVGSSPTANAGSPTGFVGPGPGSPTAGMGTVGASPSASNPPRWGFFS